MTKAACYLRVSTDRQDHANQRPDVERLAAARGLELDGRVYEEVESGAKADRPVLRALMEFARRGGFRVLVIWSIDRLGRSMWGAIDDLRELDRLGVRVISVQEPWLDTTGPMRDLLLAIFAWLAQHERDRLRERTKAGLARARAQGKRLGRPPVARPDPGKVRALRETGASWARVAAVVEASVWACRRAGESG
jgi:DNA invertase Pin-like site-specific DNA recombinase